MDHDSVSDRARKVSTARVRLTEMDAELAVLEQRQAKTRALKQGMMQELVTGNTQLITREVDDA